MIPARLLPHTITVTPFLGSGPYGDVWGDPVTVAARVEFQRKLVRDKDGVEVVSSATIYTQPTAQAPNLGDLIELPDGRQRPVINRGDPVGARTTHHVVVDVA